MTVQLDGGDVAAMVEGLVWTGSIVGMLVIGLIVYLMVRPTRDERARRKAERRGRTGTEMDPAEAEELWALVDRMDARLEVLERALADQTDRPAIRRDNVEHGLAPVGDDRDSGRK